MTASVHPEDIFQAIGAVLHPDPALRQQAERYVNDAYKQPGCATALLAVAAENQIEVGRRSSPDPPMLHVDPVVCLYVRSGAPHGAAHRLASAAPLLFCSLCLPHDCCASVDVENLTSFSSLVACRPEAAGCSSPQALDTEALDLRQPLLRAARNIGPGEGSSAPQAARAALPGPLQRQHPARSVCDINSHMGLPRRVA